MHKSEIEHRDEIGVDHVMFGRDYPHTEGTWPNTLDFLGDLFAGVPESDARKILGENAIRFFGFDAAALAAVADRVGPTVEQITGGPPALDPRLIEHFGMRSGYLKPFEGASRIDELDELLRDDFKGLTRPPGPDGEPPRAEADQRIRVGLARVTSAEGAAVLRGPHAATEDELTRSPCC